MKQILLVMISSLVLTCQALAQNTGIGTTAPEAKLHVNGDLKLQNGFAVNKFSRDSLFAENSHNNVPTEKATKDYIKAGLWATLDSSKLGTNALVARGYNDISVGAALSVAVQDTVAYVVSYNSQGLSTNSVKDVYNPRRLDNETTGLTFAVDVAVSGNYAYVITDELNSKLYVYNISNPRNIIPVTNINIGREMKSIALQGNFVYIVGFSPRLAIFDISNPAAPVARGVSNTNLSIGSDIVVRGNAAYVASAGNSRFCIFDITNPDNIVPQGFASTGLGNLVSVYVKDNYAYLSTTDASFNDVRIFNIADPLNITAAGIVRDVIYRPGYLRGSGNYLFVAGSNSNEISVLDISNPVAPALIGSNTSNLSFPGKIAVSGETVYLPSSGNNRLCIYQLERNRQLVAGTNGLTTVPVSWQTDGANVYRSQGYVGINTSRPQTTLDVQGSAIVNGSMSVGFANNIPEAAIHLAPQLGERIILWGTPFAGSSYGIGVQAGLLQIHSNVSTDDIGFGYGSSNFFTEVMRVKGNGNVGIGTSTPGNKLSVNGNTDIAGNLSLGATTASNRLSVTGNANFTGNVGIGNAAPAKPLSFPPALGEKILLYPGVNGEVGIGVYGNELRLHCDNPGSMVSFGTQDNAGVFTQAGRFQISGGYALYVNGSIWANGTTYASDERFKQNITAIASPLQKLLQINGVEYEMKRDAFAKNNFLPGRQIGLLAQNVEQVVPEAVRELDGYKGVDYARLVPLLIESLKELNRQNESQQKEINELRTFIQNKLK